MSDFRLAARYIVGGKSGQHRVVLLLTATESNLRESATETKQPFKRVTMKRVGPACLGYEF